MENLMLLLQQVMEESATICCTSATLDYELVKGRVKDEGISFLTISLPAFGKDFQKSLDVGLVDDQLFAGFKRKKKLPAFLSGFTCQIFDIETGSLLDEPSIEAITAVRQISLMYGKLLAPCSDARIKKALDQFVQCEKDVREADERLSQSDKDRFVRMVRLLWGQIFQNVDEDVFFGNISPQHGPGATAEKLIGNDKWNLVEWTERLEAVFPWWEYAIPPTVWRDGESAYSAYHVEILEPGEERPVRVVTVPKTPATPRIIAIEPVCMQYMQQGLLYSFLTSLKRDPTLYRIMGFDDQVPNQHLAEKGSRNGSLATLDLSEASDRVSNQLVELATAFVPNFAKALQATRSTKADVDGHGIIALSKFASMGSAFCFPMEAVIFTTVVFLGIEEELKRQMTRRDIKNLVGQVRVYGDDIVVPVDYVRAVHSTLELFGFRVNAGKSFWTGKFRESCGKDYYAGHDVTVIKVRRDLPTERRHVNELISVVSLRNQLYEVGLWQTAFWLDKRIEKLIPFPVVLESSPVLGRVSFLGYETEKMHSYLHKPLVRGWIVRGKIPDSHLDDLGAMLKCLLKRGEEPFADSRHLERAGRPDAVNLKLGWYPSI